MHIVVGRAGEPGLGAPLMDSMYRLRCAVFHERLHWRVRAEHGREHDWFDLIGPQYVIAHEDPARALGCCRLLPTTGPNMLRDIFPYLLEDGPPPNAPEIWEVSRFAVAHDAAEDRDRAMGVRRHGRADGRLVDGAVDDDRVRCHGVSSGPPASTAPPRPA